MSFPKKKEINVVIFDSNFILLPYQFKIDYLSDIYLKLEGRTRFYVFKQSLDEIEAKIKRDPKTRKLKRQFKGSMSYLDKNEKIYPIYFINEVKDANETTDDFLLKWCISFKKEFKKVFLATNDAALRRRAKKSNVNLIFLRQKKYLVIE